MHDDIKAIFSGRFHHKVQDKKDVVVALMTSFAGEFNKNEKSICGERTITPKSTPNFFLANSSRQTAHRFGKFSSDFSLKS